MSILFLAAWYSVGVLGGALLFLDNAEFEASLNRKYDIGSPVPQRCPSPFQILLVGVGGVLGVATLLAAIPLCLMEDGMWHRKGRFKWFTTPICELRSSSSDRRERLL